MCYFHRFGKLIELFKERAAYKNVPNGKYTKFKHYRIFLFIYANTFIKPMFNIIRVCEFYF